MSARLKPAAAVAAPPAASGAFALLLTAVGSAGVASLLYEVIWVRQLALSLGSTAIAGATMLSAFLAGLALGSWLAARRVDAQGTPLRSLAMLEVGAALVGALSVPMLEYAGRAYVLTASALGAGPDLSLVLRAVFSLIVMLLPATLFGVAFPLASSAAARIAGPERAASGVSAVSSFGSAIGAALGGLLLEPLFGITGAAIVAVGFNLLAATAAWMAASRAR